jgi:uncharacterized protein (PEP-CTERM system associated)
VVGLLLMSGLPALAQTPGTSLAASLDTRLTYNVNSRLGGLDGAEWVGEVTPSIRLASRSGRVVGSLDYGLTLVGRSRNDPSSESVNRLAATMSAELVPRRLSLDASASIGRQSVSAFGLQSVEDSAVANRNRQEVGNAAISPVLRGVFAGAVSYEARLFALASNTRRSLEGDSLQTGGSLALSSIIPGTLLSWGLNARSAETDSRTQRTTRSDIATASLGWQADADLSLSARAGSESQNVQDFNNLRSNTWGLGATWRPSPRTRLQASVDDRFFGRGYSVVAEHRLPRSSFSFTSSRDSSNRQGGQVEPLTLFDLLMAIRASEIPDPVAREEVVRAELALAGRDPSAVARPGFVVSSVSVAERHQGSWIWSGRRLSLSAQAFRGTTRGVDIALSEFAREPIRQSGYSSSLGYRLTPTSSLSLTGSRQMTKGTTTQPGNDLKSASLSWTMQLGLRTSASLATRYTVFNSTSDPYREAAAQAALVHRF